MEPSNKEQIENAIMFFLNGKNKKYYFDLNKLMNDFFNEKSNYYNNSNQNISFIKLKFDEFIKD